MVDKEKNINNLSYEQARDQLVEIVAKLEKGTSTLEQSLKLWETGEALSKHCEKCLTGAKKRIDAVKFSNSQDNTTQK